MKAGFLIVSLLAIGPCVAEVCQHQFQKSCFEISKKRVSSKDAWEACEGGHLADASKLQVSNFILTILKQKKLDAAWVKGSAAFSMAEQEECPVKLSKSGESDMLFTDDFEEGCPDKDKLKAVCEYDVKAVPTKKCKVHDSIINKGHLIPCTKKKAVEPGTKLKVECWTGYSLKGPEEITCKKNGKWSKRPVCEPVCAASLLQGDGITVYPLSETVDTQEHVKYYKIGETAVIICENGIIGNSTFPATHKVVTCLGSNKWSEIFPHCVPYDKLTFSYAMRAQQIVKAPNDSPVTITCPSEGDQVVSKVWTKNQRQLTSNYKYVINEDGTLTIKDFKLGDEGRYLCTIKTPPSSFEFVSYDLRVESKDAYFYPQSLEVIRMKEGESKVLFCKDSNYFSIRKWYKNGIPYYGTALGSSITDDGALYLNTVSPLDNGIYLCVVERFVEGRDVAFIVSPYQVKVVPTGKTVCGQVFYEADSTGVVYSEDEEDEEEDDEEERSSFEEHTPWFVTLFKEGETKPYCYGSLIDVKWILTSAQCFNNVNRMDGGLIAKVGMHPDDKKDDMYETIREKEKIEIHFIHPKNFTVPVKDVKKQRHFYIPYELLEEDVTIVAELEVDSQEQEDFYIEEIITHPQYDGKYQNDLALIRLEKEVPVTDIVRPICLPHLLQFTDDPNCEEARVRNGTVTTKGRFHLDGKVTRAKHVDIHRHQKCEKTFEFKLPPNLICIEDRVDYSDETALYKGDLGSPLEVSWLNRFTLWGVNSGSKGRYFEFNTEVLPYLDWINDKIN